MPYPNNLPSIRTHTQFPSPITGYRLDALWEVVEPIGENVVNLVANPSIELATTGYTAQGSATIARDSTWQRRGVYSLKVTPTSAQLDGAYYATVSVVGGRIYTLSLDLKAPAGVKYRFYIANDLGNAVSRFASVTASGVAQRVSVTYQDPHTAGATILRRIYVTKDYSTSTQPFWIDGLSLTQTAYPVTYFDGDSVGFIPGRLDFYWNGTAHGSTSTMASYTRAGGRITPLSRYGLTILAMLGVGMQPIVNISTPLAFIGGGQYQRTISSERLFDLAGQITAPSLSALQINRRKLLDLLRPNATPSDTPLILRYTPIDSCGDAIGDTVEIPCLYESGMEGNITNHYQEPVALRFHSYLPYLGNVVGNVGQALSYQQTLSTGGLFGRDLTGFWSRLGTVSTVSTVYAILPLPDGRLLIGGNITNIGGDPFADYLVFYDYTTNLFSRVNTTPLSDEVYTLALLADGDTVIVGGAFQNAGSNPTADFICAFKISTGAYTALNLTALIASKVNKVIVLPSGDMVVAGDMLNAGGNASADYLIKVNGTTLAFQAWNATPLDGEVEEIALLNNGDVLFSGGGITSPVLHIGYLTVSTGAFSDPNTDATTWAGDSPSAITVSPSGLVYLGAAVSGGFYSWAGPGAAYILLGSVGGGFLGNAITTILALPNGNVIVGGFFATADSLTLPSKVVGWNGSSFYFIDIDTSDLNASGYVSELALTADGKLVMGLNGTIDGPSAYVNTVVVTASADATPIFGLTGPGNLYSILNTTTDESLYFNLTLLANERAVLDLTPGRIRFYSNFRPNLLGTILPGSSLATFRLVPGTNYISVFIAGTVTVTTASNVRWRNALWSIDSAAFGP